MKQISSKSLVSTCAFMLLEDAEHQSYHQGSHLKEQVKQSMIIGVNFQAKIFRNLFALIQSTFVHVSRYVLISPWDFHSPSQLLSGIRLRKLALTCKFEGRHSGTIVNIVITKLQSPRLGTGLWLLGVCMLLECPCWFPLGALMITKDFSAGVLEYVHIDELLNQQQENKEH